MLELENRFKIIIDNEKDFLKIMLILNSHGIVKGLAEYESYKNFIKTVPFIIYIENTYVSHSSLTYIDRYHPMHGREYSTKEFIEKF